MRHGSSGKAMVERPNKILIVRTDRLGDVILSTPVIKNLRNNFKNAHIAFMCRPYTRDVLEGNPYLNEVIVYDKYGKHRSIWNTMRFSFNLKKKKFDWALILHPTNRAHLITFLAGIPFRAGWNRKNSLFLTRRLFHNKQEGRKHELEYTLDILRDINIPIVDKTTYFPIKRQAEEKVRSLLKGCGLNSSDKLIIMHPSASCLSKRWPQANFSELIKLVKDKLSFKIAIITSENEKKHGQKIIDENNVIDLRGKLNISEIGSLLKRASLFISNDSGPVHIAVSLNIPVISIFGRKNPGLSPLRWKPLGESSFYFHEDAGCAECPAHNCKKGFICLKKITPQNIAKKAITILNK